MELYSSEAVILSIKQILLSQQDTVTLSINQIGMFLCKWLSWLWSGSQNTDENKTDLIMTDEQRQELYDAIEWDEKKNILVVEALHFLIETDIVLINDNNHFIRLIHIK
ncbi:hypothetical protein PORY_002686 [Pneumocystis oryctolagi]|uniref:Uncharacterized protein n=1 Tax=Pneumocystis oryctolagi TaxID=42067 RepID=A0ACB7CBT7_9ASCO|nr:hypothetical protein PORY_002686 [Pneumocystis oryctolagi]